MIIAKKLYQSIPFKKQLFSGLKYCWQPPERIYRHLHFRDVFTIKAGNGKSFRMHHYGYQLENELFWEGVTGGWEKVSMTLWIDLCAISNCIFDIGTNTGVYAFEPVKRVFEKLRRNVELNGYPVHCFEVAISDADGKAVIYDTPGEHVYSVTVNKNLSSANQEVIRTEIETITLASFVRQANIQNVDLLKIDVETHEPEVLAGFGEYLAQMKPTMLIEILTDEVGQRLESVLAGKGYLYFEIDEKNPPRLVQRLTKSSHFNYLVCQPHIARKLQLIS